MIYFVKKLIELHPGTLEAITMSEQILEHIAFEMGLDPLEVRMKNLDQQYPLESMIKNLKEKSEYDTRKTATEEFNKVNLNFPTMIFLKGVQYGLTNVVRTRQVFKELHICEGLKLHKPCLNFVHPPFVVFWKSRKLCCQVMTFCMYQSMYIMS